MEQSKSMQTYFERADNIPDFLINEKQDLVMLFIAKKGCAYPTEIARECDLHPEVVNRILFNLNKLGFTEKTYAEEEPNPLLKGRIRELWMNGVFGLAMFQQFSWWTLTNGGVDYLFCRYSGKGHKIRNSLLIFHNINTTEK